MRKAKTPVLVAAARAMLRRYRNIHKCGVIYPIDSGAYFLGLPKTVYVIRANIAYVIMRLLLIPNIDSNTTLGG